MLFCPQMQLQVMEVDPDLLNSWHFDALALTSQQLRTAACAMFLQLGIAYWAPAEGESSWTPLQAAVERGEALVSVQTLHRFLEEVNASSELWKRGARAKIFSGSW